MTGLARCGANARIALTVIPFTRGRPLRRAFNLAFNRSIAMNYCHNMDILQAVQSFKLMEFFADIIIADIGFCMVLNASRIISYNNIRDEIRLVTETRNDNMCA
jgi:hypothetical protein